MRVSLGQLWALTRATARELAWGLCAVSQEIDHWRARALTIADSEVRRDALISLQSKRGHTDGAALFWTIPDIRSHELLRLLVAYELIWDFLDNLSERGAGMGEANGRQLHLALIDALDRDAVSRDYYRHHPWKDDRGYLAALVAACQQGCARLPSYSHVRTWLLTEGANAQVLALNHHCDPACREHSLQQWARDKLPRYPDVAWFELAGAASASLTIHALLALATNPALAQADIEAVHAIYFPWLSLATTMLDSHVDQAEDLANDEHSYVAHYPNPELATQRIGEIVGRSMNAAAGLCNGRRHVVIAACMVAMYLSKDSADAPGVRESSRRLARAAGPLPRLLLPVLRAWRTAYAQRSA